MDKVLHDFGSAAQAAEIVALLQALQAQTFFDNSDFYSDDPLATPDHTNQAPAVELDVANQVFSQKGMTLQQAFLDALSSQFDAGVGLLDYKADPDTARQTINRWAGDATKGRIPEILQPPDVTQDTRIALANAIYFKAGWQAPFDPANTETFPSLEPTTPRSRFPR